MKRRRLSDLYVQGKEVSLNDGGGDPVVVWLQKLNGVDRESCLRRANAGKARFMLEADKEDSEIFQAMYAQVRDMQDRNGLIGVVIAEELGHYRQRIEAERSADEKTWGKDNYLQGLIDAWIGDDNNPGLAATQTESPDDLEVKRVLSEIERFEDEVSLEVRALATTVKKDWEDVPDDKLWRKATHRLLEMRGNEVFNAEFERQQLFFCVREPDNHAKRYFGTLADLDDLHETIVASLVRQYGRMVVDATEGKDSRASQPSLNSSGPSPAEEASSDSGLEVVNV